MERGKEASLRGVTGPERKQDVVPALSVRIGPPGVQMRGAQHRDGVQQLSPKGVGIVGIATSSIIRERSRSRLSGEHSPPLASGSASPPPDGRSRAGSGAERHLPPQRELTLAAAAAFEEDCGSEETVDVIWTADSDTLRFPALAPVPPSSLAPLAINTARPPSANSLNGGGGGGVESRDSTPGSNYRTYSMTSLAEHSLGPTPMTPAFASPQPWARQNSSDSMSQAGGAFGSICNGIFGANLANFATVSTGSVGNGLANFASSGADSPAGASRPHGRIRRGRWRKGKPIGLGTCGKVYLGLNDDTGELMAVKEVTLESKEKQLRELYTEIQVMHRLRHPHIVAYLGAELVDSQRTLCIFQEWVPAGSLHQLLEHFGALGERMTATYTRQVLLGLAYLHANGVIHRDVKATNILVDDRGRVKLADFGCALLLDEGGASSRDSLTMSIKGTPLFMAPEILLRQRSGRRVDIWSLGCVVMEMATTRPPWDDMFTHPVQLIAHFHEHKGPPPMPAEISEPLRAFLLRCFTWEPKERPRARELLEDAFLTHGGVNSPLPVGGAEGDGAGNEDEVPLERMNQRDAMQRLRKASSFDLLNSAAHRNSGSGSSNGAGGSSGMRLSRSTLAAIVGEEDETAAAEARRRRRSAAASTREAAVAHMVSVAVTADAIATGSASGSSSGGEAPPAISTNALVAAALAANAAAVVAASAAAVGRPASARAAAWRLRRHSTGTCAAARSDTDDASAGDGEARAPFHTIDPEAPAPLAAADAAAAVAAAAGREREAATVAAAAAAAAAAGQDPQAAAAAASERGVVAAAATSEEGENLVPAFAPRDSDDSSASGYADAAAAVLVTEPDELGELAPGIVAPLAIRAVSFDASLFAPGDCQKSPPEEEGLLQAPLLPANELVLPPPDVVVSFMPHLPAPLAKTSEVAAGGSAPSSNGGRQQTPLTTPQAPWSPGIADDGGRLVTPERATGKGRHRAMTLAWGLRHPGGN